MRDLLPFAPAAGAWLLQAECARMAGRLRVCFELRGQLADLLLPMPAKRSGPRREGLWEHSCFELFAGPVGAPAYAEWNFSPNGDWCAFAFSDARQRQQPPPRWEQKAPLAWHCLRKGDERLELSVELQDPFPEAAELEAGLSAVLECKAGSLEYWALAHPREKADFHARAAFLLRL